MQENPQLTTKIIRKVEEVSPEDWSRVFPDILESYYFFRAIDESSFCEFSFYYILVYNNTSLVGIAPCFLMNYPLDTTIEGPFKKITGKLINLFPRLLNPKIIICGSCTCEGRIGISQEYKNSVFKEMICAMEEIAKEESVSMLAFKDFSIQYNDILNMLSSFGYYRMASFPSVELDIHFKSFEEYLKTLSRSTRKDLKRKFSKLDTLEKITFKVSNSLDDLLDNAYELYLQTFSKSDVQFEKIPKDFFTSISRNMPSEAKFFTWHLNDKLIAFNLCLSANGKLIDEYIGMDYAYAYKFNLYFVTFRDIINYCIENGIKKYESGALTYEPKRRLGCNFLPLNIYAKHNNKIINPFFKILCCLIKPENFDPVLRKMKKEGLI